MSRKLEECLNCVQGFPRVSGDEPPVWDAICQAFTFSPRERG